MTSFQEKNLPSSPPKMDALRNKNYHGNHVKFAYNFVFAKRAKNDDMNNIRDSASSTFDKLFGTKHKN